MKKIKVILFFLILLISQTGCVDKNEKIKKWYKYVDSHYQQEKKFYKEEFLDHFPKNLFEIHNLGVTTIGKPGKGGDIRYCIQVFYEKTIFDSILISTKNRAFAEYKSTDKDLLVLDRFTNYDNVGLRPELLERERAYINNTNFNGKLPIPNFWNYDFSTNKTEYRLPEDYVIYVLEAKAGKFWNEKYLTNGETMPKEWKNGYSKGVAINEKKREIIYWFILW